MGMVLQKSFCLPDVSCRHLPVVPAKGSEVGNRVTHNSSTEINIGLHVAQCEVAGRTENRLAPVEAGVTRPRDRSPPAAAAIHEHHMVEQVLRFQAQNQRRVSVVLEDDGRRERSLQTMRGPMFQDLSKAPKGCVACGMLDVVREPIEEALNVKRGSVLVYHPTFAGRESLPIDCHECSSMRSKANVYPDSVHSRV